MKRRRFLKTLGLSPLGVLASKTRTELAYDFESNTYDLPSGKETLVFVYPKEFKNMTRVEGSELYEACKNNDMNFENYGYQIYTVGNRRFCTHSYVNSSDGTGKVYLYELK